MPLRSRPKIPRGHAQASLFDGLGAAHDRCGMLSALPRRKWYIDVPGAHAWHQPAAAVAALWRKWKNASWQYAGVDAGRDVRPWLTRVMV
eukprot:366335-Chlamydomonas_euryale.AAC.10